MTLRFLTSIAACALAFASAPALAQEQASPPAATQPAPAPLPDANPALFVVRDADTTIYLFGTFHLLDGRPWFNDEIRTAFNASNELVLEALIPDDPASLQPMVLRYAVDPQHRKLSDRISPEDRDRLGRSLGAAGLPATAFDALEPWFVAMTVTVLQAQQLHLASENGPETLLMHTARERGMALGELEGFEFQIRMLDSMPEELQLKALHETLTEVEDTQQKLGSMLDAWSRGDVEGLQRLIDADNDEDPGVHRIMFTDRNAAWARWIEQRLARPGTVFVAVGAGHLAGRDSVLADLRARHLRVDRVPHVSAP